MNILFITLLDMRSIHEHNIYSDLMREFVREGHSVYIVSPLERRSGAAADLIKEENAYILKLRTGNIQKAGIIEKGISTVLLGHRLTRGIRRHFRDIRFGLVLYSTPPITVLRAVAYVKRRDGAATYLMLKDIFPQNAVDLGMLSDKGVRGLLCRYFRRKEKRLYRQSDFIGCMSEANARYLQQHNKDIPPSRIEICPNCMEPSGSRGGIGAAEKDAVRKKYGIPQDAVVFVYGGNLGKPQGIDFIISCLKAAESVEGIFILIAGSGTEYGKLDAAIKNSQLAKSRLTAHVPQEEYGLLLQLCHVGLLFLDFRFTIPNFPSRLLSYMDARLPVLAVVDESTDVGEVIHKGGFGWECRSNDAAKVAGMLERIRDCTDLEAMGNAGRAYLEEHYSAGVAFKAIMSHFTQYDVRQKRDDAERKKEPMSYVQSRKQ